MIPTHQQLENIRLPDPVDVASATELQNVELALRQIDTSPEVVNTSRKCLACSKKLPKGRDRWCDTDCRDDWQEEEDAKARRRGR